MNTRDFGLIRATLATAALLLTIPTLSTAGT